MSRTLFVLALALAAGTVCHADVPRIVYDAAAVNEFGMPLPDGAYSATFRVYLSATGGLPVWSETIDRLDVKAGRLRVELGRINALDLEWADPHYVSVQYESGLESPQRTPLHRPQDRSPLAAVSSDIAYLAADSPLYEPTESGLPVGAVPGGNWGAEIGSYEGVIAYSNGADTGSWSSLEPYGPDGYQYQCVEYVRRFYRLHLGMSTVWYGNANDYYANGPGWGLERYPNNGTSLPQPDDILCFNYGTWGHVSVVTSVTSTRVNVIQQNVSSTTAYGYCNITNGIVYGSSCQGWLRKPGNGGDTTPPVISSVQANSIRSNAATITWATDDASTSRVDYGLTSSYGQSTTEDTSKVTSHSVGLSGLTPSTTYHYRVKSTNGANLTTYSGDYTFTTTATNSEIIVDDLDSEASYSGSWAQGTYSGGWPVGASEYKWANSATATNATFTWRPSLTAGYYDIYVYYLQGTNRVTNAPFTIAYNGGSTTAYVDQTTNGSQWYQIASNIPFSTGTAGYVRLVNGTGSTGYAVVADAVKFVKRSSAPTTPSDGTPVANSTVGITWKWTDVSDETGYRVKDTSGVNKSDDLAANTVQWTESSLVPNTQYTRRVYAFNTYGESSGSTGQSRYTLAKAGESTDGAGSTGNVYCTTASKNTWYPAGKTFTFSNPAGFGTGGTWKASKFEYKWNKSTTESWATAGTTWNTGTISLTPNQSDGDYYLHVRAFNGDNTANNTDKLSYGPFKCDVTPPGDVTASDEGSYTPSLDTLKASWTASSDTGGSGLHSYEYAVGTSTNTQDVKGWTSAALNTSVTITGLTLVEGTTYYIQVRAKDNAGNFSAASVTDGIIAAPGVSPISSAWSKANGTEPLSLRNKVVTAKIGDAFWLEEIDRSNAIKVLSGASVAKGNTVSVAGVLGMSGTQRVLLGDVVINAGGSVLIQPLGVTTKWLGGANYNPATPGVTGGVGQYNIGLLVRCWGKVTYSNTTDPSNKYFYLDDGSGLSSDGHSGVKVWCEAIDPPTSGTVIVTGVISTELIGGKVVPVMLVREAGDISAP